MCGGICFQQCRLQGNDRFWKGKAGESYVEERDVGFSSRVLGLGLFDLELWSSTVCLCGWGWQWNNVLATDESAGIIA